MNKIQKMKTAIAVAIGVGLAGIGAAQTHWVTVGDLRPSHTTQEIAVNLPASVCRIHSLQGSVVIHSLIVSEGLRHTAFRVERRLGAGQSIDIDLGGARNITGLHITDSSHGRYQVQLNTAAPPRTASQRRRHRNWVRDPRPSIAPPTHTEPVRSRPGNWARVAILQASPDAKEVAVNRNVSSIRIRVIEGTVIINTVVARQGTQRTAYTVGRRLQTGQHVDVDLGGRRNVTGLRISDDGRGRYEIQAR